MKSPNASTPEKPAREAQINLALKKEEKDLAERVAAKRGLKVSALVRMLILDEARRLGVE